MGFSRCLISLSTSKRFLDGNNFLKYNSLSPYEDGLEFDELE